MLPTSVVQILLTLQGITEQQAHIEAWSHSSCIFTRSLIMTNIYP